MHTKLLFYLTCCYLATFLVSPQAIAQTKTLRWTGAAGTTDWNNLGNWALVGGGTLSAPTSIDNIQIPNSSNATQAYPKLPAHTTIKSLTLLQTDVIGGGIAVVGASIDLDGYTLTIQNGDLLVAEYNASVVVRRLGHSATGGKIIVQGGSLAGNTGWVRLGGTTSPIEIHAEVDFYIPYIDAGSNPTGGSWRRTTFFHKAKINLDYAGTITNFNTERTIFKDDVEILMNAPTLTLELGRNPNPGTSPVFTLTCEKNLAATITAGTLGIGRGTTGNQIATAQLIAQGTGTILLREATFTGAMTAKAQATGAIDLDNVTCQGTTLLETTNLTAGNGIRIAHDATEVCTFQQTLTLRNTAGSLDSPIRLARQGNVFLNDNLVAQNTGGTSGLRSINVGDSPTEAGIVYLAAGKVFSVLAANFTAGQLQINKVVQPHTHTSHTHTLHFTGNASVYLTNNELAGNITLTCLHVAQFIDNTLGSLPSNVIDLKVDHTNPAVEIFCGGNTFKGITYLRNAGRGKWYWGHTANNGGADRFEANAFFIANDPYTANTPPTRPTNYQNNYPTNFPTNNTTSYPTPVDWIQPPYYVAKSGTWTGTKVGFAAYPRLDNLPTNTGDPAQDAANAAANATAANANLTDEAQSEMNVVEATQNAQTTLTTITPARAALTAALNTTLNALNTTLTLPAYTNAEGGVQSLHNALQTAYNNANTYLATFDNLRNILQTNANNLNNAPSADHTAANNAIAGMNTLYTHVNTLYHALNQLNTEINTQNTLHNASLTAIIADANNTGILSIAHNSANNDFLGEVSFSTSNKGQGYIAYTTGAIARFYEDLTIHNTSQGADFNAFFVAHLGTNPQIINHKRVIIQQNAGGAVVWARRGISTITGNLEINILSGTVFIGQTGQPGSTTLAGNPVFTLTGGRLAIFNFIKNATTPSIITTQNTARWSIGGVSTWNGDLTLQRQSTGGLEISPLSTDAVSFTGKVYLRNQQTGQIQVSQNGNTTFHDDVQVENTIPLSNGDTEAIVFGASTGLSHLANGKKITVGEFRTGQLTLSGIRQQGSSMAQSIVMNTPLADDSTTLSIQGSIFEAAVSINANRLRLQTSTYQQVASFICQHRGLDGGGNTFQKNAYFEFRSQNGSSWTIGSTGADIFQGEAEFYNNGRGTRFFIAHNSPANVFYQKVICRNGGTLNCDFYIAHLPNAEVVFKDEIILQNNRPSRSIFVGQRGKATFEGAIRIQNTPGGNFFFGGNSTNATLNGQIVVKPSGSLILETAWASGQLHLKNFDYQSTTAINLPLSNGSNNAQFFAGPNSIFQANIEVKARNILLNGAVYHGTASFEKLGSGGAIDESQGGNTFHDLVRITNRHPQELRLAVRRGDNFNGNVIFDLPASNSGRITPAYAGASYFKANITITGASNSRIDFGIGGGASEEVGTGAAIFNGSGTQILSNQLLSTRSITFRELVIAQQTPTSQVNFDRGFTVRMYLSMVQGKINLGTSNIRIENETDPTSVSIANTNSYVIADGVGVIIRQVANNNSNVLFPCGSTTGYTPATLRQSSTGTTDLYRVRLLNNVFLNYNFAANFAPSGAPIGAYFVRRTWIITEATTGGSDISMTLQWNSDAPSDEMLNFNRNFTSIVRFTNAGLWSCTQVRGAAQGPPNTRRTSTGIRNMGVFSVASVIADAGVDRVICVPASFTLAANSLDAPFQGEWSQVAGPNTLTIANINDPNTFVHGALPNSTYTFRWRNKSLEGDCGSNIFDDVVITVGNALGVGGITSVTWEGDVSNDWFDCQNWTDLTVPNENIDVVIPQVSGPNVPPVIANLVPRAKNLNLNTNALLTIQAAGGLNIAQSLSLQANSTLQNMGNIIINQHLNNNGGALLNTSNLVVHGNINNNSGSITADAPDAQIQLSGNLTNNTPWNHTQGIVRLEGNNSTLNGSQSPTFYNLTIDKALGQTLTLNIGTHIAGRLTLANGIVNTTHSQLLVILDNASSTEGNAQSYINGPMRKVGDEDFVFPIGKGAYWARIAVSDFQNSHPQDYFTAEYFPNKYTNLQVETPLARVSSLEHWILDRGSTQAGNPQGTTEARVTLYWESGIRSGINNIGNGDLVVARFDAGLDLWQNKGGIEFGTPDAGNVISTVIIDTFSPFTFASMSELGNPLPARLRLFEAQRRAVQQVALEWLNDNEQDLQYYVLERSTNGQDFVALGIVESRASTTLLRSPYQFIDNDAPNTWLYYRLKVVGLSQSYYSHIRAVQPIDEGVQLAVYPNPCTQDLRIAWQSNAVHEPYHLQLIDNLGRIVWSVQGRASVQGKQLHTVAVEHLSAGVYHLQIRLDSRREQLRVVKQ